MERHSDRWLLLKKGKIHRYWLPILLGLVITVAVFGLWQRLLMREQLHIQQLVQQEATAIESQLNRELSTRIQALEWMASRWQVSGGTPRAFWEADAANYIDHSYGYQAIEWVDPSFYVKWVLPFKGNEAAQNLDLSQETRRRITLNVARDLRQTLLTRTISLVQGGKGFLAIVPLYVKDSFTSLEVNRFDGFIVGVFRFQSLFDSLLEASPWYQVQISDGNGLIYRQETSFTGVQSETRVVQAYGADWQIQVFATSTLIDRERSPLPNLILGSGLLSAWALALVVYLGQRSERSTQQARKINQQLQAEIAERQQIKVELRRSEASNRNLSDRLYLAVQSAQIGIWDWDIPGDHLIWDDQMYRLYGVNPSDFSGVYEAWASALHPDDFELATTAIQRAIRGEKDYKPEFRVIHRDGTIRFIQAHAVVQRDSQGQAQRMIGVNLDITEQKRAELSLQESELRFRTMADSAPVLIWISELDGGCSFFNQTWLRFTGRSLAEEVGNGWTEGVHPDDLQECLNIYQTAFAARQPFQMDYRLRRFDGEYRWILDQGTPRFTSTGEFLGFIGSCQDIHDRKTTEEALRQSESTLRSFFNNEAMLMGIVELHEHDILHLSDNQTTASFFGTTPEAMQNRFASEMGVPQPHLQRWIQAYQEAERTQSPVHFEYPHETPSGQRWLAAIVCQIENRANHYPRFSYTVEDITKRKQTELELEKELLRSKALLDTSIDGIVTLDHEGNVVQLSSSFAQMIGYSMEETLKLNVSDWDAQWTREELQNILRGNVHVPPVFETRHRRKDGSLYDVEISYNRAEIDGEMTHFCICRDISERKRSEAERKQTEIALQNSQARFAGILEIASDAIISVNAEQQITLFNKGAERIFGYTAEEVIGQSLSWLMPDRFAQTHQHHVNHYAQGESRARQMSQRGAIFGRRKDGTEFPAEASISKLSLNGETIFTTFLRDITERQQAESAMARLVAIVESSEDAIIGKTLEGIITSWNAGAERIFGYTAEETVGQSVTMLLPKGYLNEENKILERIRQGEKIALYDTKRRRKDGTLVDLSINVSPIKDAKGNIIGASKIARDISERVRLDIERKRAELALQQSEARYRRIIQTAYEGIWTIDAENLTTFVNPRMAEMLGYRTEEMLGQSVFAFMSEENRKLAEHQLKHRRQGLSEQHEFQFQRQDGTSLWVLVSASPITNEAGQYGGAIAMMTDISDRKRIEDERKEAEEKLRKSEAALVEAQRMAHLGNWELDIASKQITWSDELFRMFGFDPSNPEPAYAEHFNYIHSDDRVRLQQSLDRAISEGTPYEIELRILRTDGTIGCYMEARGEAKYNSQGQLEKLFGTALDITERKQAEIALRQSEEKFRMAIDFTYNWEYWQAPDSTFVYISPSCERITEYTPEEFVENPDLLYTIVHPDDRELFAHHRCHDANSTESLDYRIITRSGETRWISHICQPVFGSSGQYLGLRASNRDISDRKQFEEDLRHQKEMFQVIVDHIPVMIALFNDQGRIDFINPEFERVLGWSIQEWQQRDVMVDLYPDPIYLQSVLDHMTAAMGNWRDFTTLTATKQQIETSWANVPISKGRFLGIGQDVSDRKRKEIALQQAMEAAEAANLAKSMFLANMSHELRTPLNVILGFTQVMSHDSSLTPAQREDLQTIQRSGDHLLSLINDVLDLSKIEAGHCTLEESGFDLISLLHTLRTMMAERARAKNLKLTFEIAPEVPQFVIADEQKLRQILLNLLSNAIKFTKQGSVTLRVTSWESSQKTCLVSNASHNDDAFNHLISSTACILQFEVADTGVGIAETERESIFDAFAQAEAGRKSIGGTGLGLTISHRLLELMDGSISVDSTLEVGSTFTVTVPVCPSSGVDGQIEHQERTIIGLLPGQPHRRILVVDDQYENRMLMVRLLTGLGLEVQEATNGQEAIALWQQWKPDLTWMDIRMPELDGYEATKQIRAMEQEQASVIIALTAQASQSDRALALAAGCNDYISKPFREETLFLKLKEYLGLEYLYAEASDLSNSPSVAVPDADVNQLSSFDPQLLAQLPANWLETIEDLALCGNDRAIVDLAAQLPPEFESLKTQVLDLANRFEFEQLVHLIHRDASP